jgi:hypothetical protein
MTEFHCVCGYRTPARDALDGRQATCPRCGRIGQVGRSPLAALRPAPESPRGRPHLSLFRHWPVAGCIGLTILAIASAAVAVAAADPWDALVIGLLAAGGVGLLLLILFLAGVPGRIARGKPRHAEIRLLGYLGILLPLCWIVALIWAFVERLAPAADVRCPACGLAVRPTARWCPSCGAGLAGSQRSSAHAVTGIS